MTLTTQQRESLQQAFANALQSDKQITIVTGAGVSAESGIPTFRGPEGYWQVGSRNYQPQEIATYEMFLRSPVEVWKWFLFRRGVCMAAEPNAGHGAIAKLENLLNQSNSATPQKRFTLITQNVDGLHLRAGSSSTDTLQVHGNLHYMRCAEECSLETYPIPNEMPAKQRGEALTAAEWQMLVCPRCGANTRPHVLLWDEFYDEHFYRSQTALNTSLQTGLMIIVGTTGAASLPNRLAKTALQAGATIVNIDLEPNFFSEIALTSSNGIFLQNPSAKVLPEIVALLDSSVNS